MLRSVAPISALAEIGNIGAEVGSRRLPCDASRRMAAIPVVGPSFETPRCARLLGMRVYTAAASSISTSICICKAPHAHELAAGGTDAADRRRDRLDRDRHVEGIGVHEAR